MAENRTAGWAAIYKTRTEADGTKTIRTNHRDSRQHYWRRDGDYWVAAGYCDWIIGPKGHPGTLRAEPVPKGHQFWVPVCQACLRAYKASLVGAQNGVPRA